MTDAAILAGGRGTRLGGVRKALIEIGGVSILDRQLAAIAPMVGQFTAERPAAAMPAPMTPPTTE